MSVHIAEPNFSRLVSIRIPTEARATCTDCLTLSYWKMKKENKSSNVDSELYSSLSDNLLSDFIYNVVIVPFSPFHSHKHFVFI